MPSFTEGTLCCSVCWRLDEDGGHIFFKCKFAVRCWREAQLEHECILPVQLQSAHDVVKKILGLEDKMRIRIAALLWTWSDTTSTENAGEGVTNHPSYRNSQCQAKEGKRSESSI
jgi:hypothetical protein